MKRTPIRKREYMTVKYRCSVCNVVHDGYMPGPTATERLSVGHKDQSGTPCPGSHKEAKWVAVHEHK